MNEIDRIITKGIIPENFLQEEVRCDYLITTKMKKIWVVELDLLYEFDKVCKEFGLRYFLIAGSLLGAVRHHGMIPWDDDIDVCMPRADYQRLIITLSNLFSFPYFFQTPETDKGYGYSFAKLRNSKTCGIVDTFRYASYNQGLYIDIFPLDNAIPEEEDERQKQILPYILSNSCKMKETNPHPTENTLQKIKKYSISSLSIEDGNKRIQDVAERYNKIKCDYWGVITCTVYGPERLIWDKKWFDKVERVQYESIQVDIPFGFNEILTKTYGNYLQFPPKDKRGTWHSDIIFDADVSYKEVLRKNKCYNNKY